MMETFDRMICLSAEVLTEEWTDDRGRKIAKCSVIVSLSSGSMISITCRDDNVFGRITSTELLLKINNITFAFIFVYVNFQPQTARWTDDVALFAQKSGRLSP